MSFKNWLQQQEASHKKLPQKLKILKLLSDKKWHSVKELHKICWRYGARLFELRQEGFILNKRKDAKGLEEWKLQKLNKRY